MTQVNPEIFLPMCGVPEHTPLPPVSSRCIQRDLGVPVLYNERYCKYAKKEISKRNLRQGPSKTDQLEKCFTDPLRNEVRFIRAPAGRNVSPGERIKRSGSSATMCAAYYFKSESDFEGAKVGDWYTVVFDVTDVPCWHKDQKSVYSLMAGEAVKSCHGDKGKAIFRINTKSGFFLFSGKALATAGVRLHLRRPPSVRVCTKEIR